MILENLGNWDWEGYMQLQAYILENYSANNLFSIGDFITADNELPNVSDYNIGQCVIWNRDGKFYVSNGSTWLEIPNVKPFKPLSDDEAIAILNQTPTYTGQIVIYSSGILMSRPGGRDNVALPYMGE